MNPPTPDETEGKAVAVPLKPKSQGLTGLFMRYKLFIEKEALKALIGFTSLALAGLIGFIVAHYKEKASFDEQLRVLHKTAALNLTNAIATQSISDSNAFLRLQKAMLQSLTLQAQSFSNQYALLREFSERSLTNALQLQREHYSNQWDQFQKASPLLLSNDFSKLLFENTLAFSNKLTEIKVSSAESQAFWLAQQKYAHLKVQYENKCKLLADLRGTFFRYLNANHDLDILLLSSDETYITMPTYYFPWEQGKLDRWQKVFTSKSERIWQARMHRNESLIALAVLFDVIELNFGSSVQQPISEMRAYLNNDSNHLLLSNDPQLSEVITNLRKSNESRERKQVKFNEALSRAKRYTTNHMGKLYFDIGNSMLSDISNLRALINGQCESQVWADLYYYPTGTIRTPPVRYSTPATPPAE